MASHLSELRSLQSTLNQAIDAFAEALNEQKLPDLSSVALEPHPLDDIDFLPSVSLFTARREALGQINLAFLAPFTETFLKYDVTACIGQLRALLQSPYQKVVEQSCAVYDTACLDIFVQAGLVDELAKPEFLKVGRSVEQLHEALDLSPTRITVVLRYLAAQGWLRETTENTFALNRPASQLRQGSAGRTWSMTPGKPKVAGSLLDFMTKPEWKYAESPAKTAFQLSHQTSDTLFQYLSRSPAQFQQWSSSVRTYGDACHGALMEDYPWDRLTSKTIVDCGAGLGTLILSLAKLPCLSDCKFIAQDLDQVVPNTGKTITASCEELMSSGRVVVEAHDFFTPQVHGAGAVVILKHILHNWPDHDCIRILKSATTHANRETKLLIIDNVVVPSTVSRPSVYTHAEEVPNGTPNLFPNYVPRNYGAASKASLALGVHMMSVFNAHERTLSQWESIAERSGLRIDKMYHVRAPDSVMECSIL
ncbi:S-adenosyl-L-methionine-dependent methyltransferase [Phlebopus sp. FC_14]|nr:S-adenosyl-L-methionine-dependent methyltransferase [Phlebopus sp. FC_14]